MKKEVKINTPQIKLDQFLKWAEVTQSGGEAKILIQDGLVKVNGQVETRRGKILNPGDEIVVQDRGIFVVSSKNGVGAL